ncbi:sulfotransferase [Nocardioides sp. SYSU D00038]|uniref:sulfotransferase n=1 Tax=Nocardioides sp. SYSU D00038 TaxID=2812554 RepID=UPI0019671E16|nr:sulfotransferase [Nocardioides sp. SYSU D00038]
MLRRGRRPEPPAAPTFLLGAGAQKAGTTWLYHYLKGSPQFAAGYRKEYHVFDTLDLPQQTYMRGRILDLAADAVDSARRGEPADADVLHRMTMYADPSHYFDFFATLLARRPETTLTADMTPENGLLSVERLTMIRAGFARRGIRTVAVLLMRDPVERVWSQVRMQHGRTPHRFGEPPEATLLRVYAEESFDTRTRYDAIVERLEASFPPEDLAFAFYETLFDRAELHRLCAFLGIAFHDPDLDHRANETTVPRTTLSPDTIRVVAEHYRDVYEFVASRFGVDLRRLWPHSAHVL